MPINSRFRAAKEYALAHTIEVSGGTPLIGEIKPPGGKWYLAHALASCLVSPTRVRITRVPDSLDTLVWIELLESLGARVSYDPIEGVLEIDPLNALNQSPDTGLIGEIRASIELTASLLVRLGDFTYAPPGGDRIGTRPIDGQLAVLKLFGGSTAASNDSWAIKRNRAKISQLPRVLTLPRPQISVTVMAVIMAAGFGLDLRIANVPIEPEIVHHAAFMRAIGYEVADRLTDEPASSYIDIRGTPGPSPHPGTIAEFELPPDPAWTVAFAVAAGVTGGRLTINAVRSRDFGLTLRTLPHMGVNIESQPRNGIECLTAQAGGEWRLDCPIVADYFPEVSTDHLPLLSILACVRHGAETTCCDRIFESRTNHFGDLCRMGASISELDGSRHFVIHGVKHLRGAADLKSRDIRGGMALLIAALGAAGRSRIDGIQHIERGYPQAVGWLRSLGADIRLVPR